MEFFTPSVIAFCKMLGMTFVVSSVAVFVMVFVIEVIFRLCRGKNDGQE